MKKGENRMTVIPKVPSWSTKCVGIEDSCAEENTDFGNQK